MSLRPAKQEAVGISWRFEMDKLWGGENWGFIKLKLCIVWFWWGWAKSPHTLLNYNKMIAFDERFKRLQTVWL